MIKILKNRTLKNNKLNLYSWNLKLKNLMKSVRTVTKLYYSKWDYLAISKEVNFDN